MRISVGQCGVGSIWASKLARMKGKERGVPWLCGQPQAAWATAYCHMDFAAHDSCGSQPFSWKSCNLAACPTISYNPVLIT